MALWLDDLMTERDKWKDMSAEGQASLIELMTLCKRSGNDGMFNPDRLEDVRNLRRYPNAFKELQEAGWVHPIGYGCGTEYCPPGLPGYYVLHDFLQRNESAAEMTKRIESKSSGGRKGNHVKWHVNKGVVKPSCRFCQEEAVNDR